MSEKNHYLYRIVPTRLEMLTEGPTGEEESVLEQHVSYLGDLTERGIVILAGRTRNNDESTFGIVIMQVESEKAARRVMEEDPAVRDGVMRAELYPYQIAFRGDERTGAGEGTER